MKHDKPNPKKTGAGSEAARGIHSKQTSKDKAKNHPDHSDRPGSEPLAREVEHKGSYGGEGGSPRTSSDQRNSGDAH